MKRWIRPLLLLAMLVSVLTVSAAAAETPTVDGIYGVSESGVITPRTAGGSAVSASDAYAGYEGFYADAVKFDVTCSGLAGNEQYLLLVLSDKGVPTDDNIVYINQKASDADGAVTFDGLDAAYPSKLEKDKTYYVYVVGEGQEFKAETSALTSFQYYQSYEPGDVNEDGSININDAMGVINHIVGNATLTDNHLLAADVNADTAVNINDAMMIINYIVGNITEEEFGK